MIGQVYVNVAPALSGTVVTFFRKQVFLTSFSKLKNQSISTNIIKRCCALSLWIDTKGKQDEKELQSKRGIVG